MKMYNGPQISNEIALQLSGESGLEVSNRTYKGVSYPVIKNGAYIIDTALNYISEDYQEIVDGLKGNVLILGLGIGRGIIGACAGSQVKSVTVVENTESIIDLFWKINGNEFKGVKKLSIVLGDATEYQETEFDHVFIDIFHPPFSKQYYQETMDGLRERFEGLKIHFIDLY